jgi:hypothetical protein
MRTVWLTYHFLMSFLCCFVSFQLTGRWVFYSTEDDQSVRIKVREGERPELPEPPRSIEERKLVELMNRCWEKDPDQRINIFDAVAFLRKAEADPIQQRNITRA